MKYEIKPLLVPDTFKRHGVGGGHFYSTDVERFLNVDVLDMSDRRFYQFNLIKDEENKRYIVISTSDKKHSSNRVISKKHTQRVLTELLGSYSEINDKEYRIIDSSVGLNDDVLELIAIMSASPESITGGILFLTELDKKGYLDVIEFPQDSADTVVIKMVKKELKWWTREFCDTLEDKHQLNRFRAFIDKHKDDESYSLEQVKKELDL